MPVKWLREALNNLDEIAAFIAQESPAAAKQVVDRLQKATQRLSQHPQMGRPGRVSGTRELALPDLPFIIPYRVRQSTVEILRVFHTSRRLPAGW
jgi:toxin ParE1/3/4